MILSLAEEREGVADTLEGSAPKGRGRDLIGFAAQHKESPGMSIYGERGLDSDTRFFIRGCPVNEIGRSCKVTDDCLSYAE